MEKIRLIATDLDRTLLPNGKQEYDGSMGIFRDIIVKEGLALAYVTGRHLGLVRGVISEFNLPVPDFLVAEAGTRLHYNDHGSFILDDGWVKKLKTPKNWNVKTFREELLVLNGIRLQEYDKQNDFKLSYYIDDVSFAHKVVKSAQRIIGGLCKDAVIIYSMDEKNNIGLLDITPKHATKLAGLEYFRKKLRLLKKNVVYCGDSGNDVLPLTFGYTSILVRNATDEVRNEVKNACISKDRIGKLYIAKGYKKLNGYYVSGIIEGLINLGIVSQKYAE